MEETTIGAISDDKIPEGLRLYFQESDFDALDLQPNVNLVIQRTLDFGNWDEIRWLFRVYGAKRVQTFLRLYGERLLSPVSFNIGENC